MPDPCGAIRKKAADLNERVADLKEQISGATGSVLHTLAGQLTLALNQSASTSRDLARCEAANPPVGTPPVLTPPVVTPPVVVPPKEDPDACLSARIKTVFLEETVADLREQIVGATGSVLHGLAGRLTQALNKLADAQRELAACEKRYAGWAILLCHWSDDTSTLTNRQFFEDLFTSSGAGSLNMTDYFTDSSHGKVDLDGTEVFGWFDIGFDRSAYVGNAVPKAKQLDRSRLLERAKSVAREDGVDLSRFFGVVVCFNTQTDLFGGAAGACCDLLSFQPSVLGQEMCHVYGLDHSRRDGSTVDYEDRWDTMSTWGSTFRAAHARWTQVGPGLNAWNMRSMGWLNEKRVWHSSLSPTHAIVELRPLHRRELPGFLAAELPGRGSGQVLLVEFRDVDRWDAGIPGPAVLVHRFNGHNSYIMQDRAGSDSLTRGSVLQYGDPKVLTKAFGRIEVLDIDTRNRIARLDVRFHRATGVVAEPPTELVAGDGTEDNATGRAVRRTAFGKAVERAHDELGRSEVLTAPAPEVPRN